MGNQVSTQHIPATDRASASGLTRKEASYSSQGLNYLLQKLPFISEVDSAASSSLKVLRKIINQEHQPPPKFVPTEVERALYMNSSKITHDFGKVGISGLAPLSSIKDVDKKKDVIPIILGWTQGGETVHITGTFNNWKKIRMTKSTSDFTTIIDLSPGTHRLKFIVDNEWKCSDDLPIASDADGNLVNYIQVVDGKGDNVGDGLDGLSGDNDQDDDDAPKKQGLDNRFSHLSVSLKAKNNFPTSESPPESYSNIIPSYLLQTPTGSYTSSIPLPVPPRLPSSTTASLSIPNSNPNSNPRSQKHHSEELIFTSDEDNERLAAAASASAQSESEEEADNASSVFSAPTEPPPLLPKHCEKILLNSINECKKDDPSLLPVPNHVNLNHLYACSIRDKVMALACTARYKKKYVTTVLYKPV